MNQWGRFSPARTVPIGLALLFLCLELIAVSGVYTVRVTFYSQRAGEQLVLSSRLRVLLFMPTCYNSEDFIDTVRVKAG